MRATWFYFLFCVGFLLQAQSFPSEVFHEGFLVTSNRDTLEGQLKYDMETNIVNIRGRGVIKTFSSHKVLYFEIFDRGIEQYRQFYSMPYNVNYGYKIPILFELQYEGSVSLLTREAIVQEAVPSVSNYWGGSYNRLRLVYSFYFVDIKGNITYFSGRKNDLLDIMKDKSSYVKDYIKENKLRPDYIQDLVRITAFYNSI